jgi:hypothetical protein
MENVRALASQPAQYARDQGSVFIVSTIFSLSYEFLKLGWLTLILLLPLSKAVF